MPGAQLMRNSISPRQAETASSMSMICWQSSTAGVLAPDDQISWLFSPWPHNAPGYLTGPNEKGDRVLLQAPCRLFPADQSGLVEEADLGDQRLMCSSFSSGTK